MTEATGLDTAHAAMEAAPEDVAARLRFYERLAASELFLLLEEEAAGATVSPRSFAIEGQSYVLVFDREERLARFAGRAAPYVALSGRGVAEMLAAEGLGMALNPDVAPSAMLLPAPAVAWLAGVLAPEPAEAQARLRELRPPHDLPEGLLTALDARLASAAGLASSAYLAGVTYETGGKGHLLGVIDALPGAEAALARAVSDLLQLAGIEAAALDVAFFAADDPISARLARVGLRFDLPPSETSPHAAGAVPGMDPARPPSLK